MSHVVPDNRTQVLEGTLERITFQNEENGYTVARLVPKGKAYEVTIIGALAGLNVGEAVRLQGTWVTHPKHGRQFEVSSYRVELPATVEGIRKYLGSGLVKGIGPANATRIVDYFGLQTLEVIDSDAYRLQEVPGIGPKRAAGVARAWEEQRQIKEIMLFLQSHGVSATLAVKIYKQYGDQAAAVVRNSPYQLAKDVYGIGFKTADRIARQMGMTVDAPQRLEAGLLYALSKGSDAGHCFATRPALLAAASQLLEVEQAACETALDAIVTSEEAIEVTPAEAFPEGAIYLAPFHYAEQGVANKLMQLRAGERDRLDVFHTVDWDAAFAWLATNKPIRLTQEQQAGVRMALTERVSILTGGPGTGKSTIMDSLIDLLMAKGKTVLLAAPTGRAAKRLSETTGRPAKTIHRLLEFRPGQATQFARDAEDPLDADLVIVDEASMIDILLMNHLLKAIEAGTHLLIVGDADQLPSVGAGNVLRDLIDSGTVPLVRLHTIFRQSESSTIVLNAHRINRGELPLFTRQSTDFYFFKQPEPEAAADLIVDIVAHRVPDRFGFDPITGIQVLCPIHRGPCGVSALNLKLQQRLNPDTPGRTAMVHGSRVIRVGDRMMQVRNDYDRQVFNGDMGIVTAIDLEDLIVTVDVDGSPVVYEVSQLDELVHAYAVSIHKAQGSEFPAVVVPMLTQHAMMLQRNLLYTAITRARELVVLVGNRRAIAIAVHNNQIVRRNTGLAARLTGRFPLPRRRPRAPYTHTHLAQ